MLSSSKWALFFKFFSWAKLYMHLYSLPCVLYIPPNSSPLYTWQALQIIRLLIMQSSPRSCTSSLTGPVLSLAPCFKSPQSTFRYHCISHPCKTREMCNIMYCCSTYCIFSDAMCGTYCACLFYFTHITWTVTSEQFQQCGYCHLSTYSYIHLHVWDSIKPCKHLFCVCVCTFSCLLHASMLCCYLGPAELQLTNAGPITE